MGRHVGRISFRPTTTMDSLRIEILFSFEGCHKSLDPLWVYGSGRATAYYILTLSSSRSLYSLQWAIRNLDEGHVFETRPDLAFVRPARRRERGRSDNKTLQQRGGYSPLYL